MTTIQPADVPGTLGPPGIPAGTATQAGEQDRSTLAVANAALRSGFVLLPRTILHAPSLSRDAKLLYAVLLSYAWQEGSCFPGYERLQEDLQCSVNSVTKYMQELEQAKLISRRRRGLGKTNIYTINDLPGLPSAKDTPTAVPATERERATTTKKRKSQTHKSWDSGLTPSVTPAPQLLRRKYDSPERDSEEQHQPAPLATEALPKSFASESASNDAADVVALLLAQGVTKRVALSLASNHPSDAIQQQMEWHRYRPTVNKNPAGALVRAIRDDWAPPQAWLDAKAHEAAVARQGDRQAKERAARQAEEEDRRRRWDAMTPEERIQGPLVLWTARQKLHGREPTAAEIAARQAELIAQLGIPEGVVRTA